MNRLTLPDVLYIGIVQFALKIVVAITGASGVIYAQRLLDRLDPGVHQIYLVVSSQGQEIIKWELKGQLMVNPGVIRVRDDDLQTPLVSGTGGVDAMVIVPCSMGTLARIATGIADSVITRAADVMLKERRKLILVPRETPLNLIHIKNMERVLLAGAILLPAMPAFYHLPRNIEDLTDFVVGRILDHLGIEHNLVGSWPIKSGND